MVGAGVVQELVDGGVELNDVGHHVFAGDVVHHAHFGLEPQARQGRAQVVRNAGQHHRAVLFQFGQLLGHAVEADVHLADFAGHHLFVQVAGGEVSVFDAVGGVRQLLERAVDQPRNGRSAGQRQRSGGDEPDEPGAPARRAEARSVHQQPVGVAVDVEAHPQAVFSVHALRHDGVGPQAPGQLLGQAAAQRAAFQQGEFVARLAGENAHAFLVGHRLDERNPRNRVGVHQRCAAEVDQRGNLLRRVQRAGLKLQRPQRLQPGQNAAYQQQRQQKERAPKKIQPHAGTLLARGAQRRFQRCRAGHVGCWSFRCAPAGPWFAFRLGHGGQLVPSGTNT